MIKKTVGFTSILLFIITGGIIGFYSYLRYSIIPTYQQKMAVMAQTRATEINTYLNEQEKNAIQLSQEPVIIDLLNNKPDNKGEQQSITALISTHKEPMGFKNIVLVGSNGTILFSTKKELIGININQPLHTNSSLGKSYERASMTLTNDFSSFNFNTLLQEPALFITIPILKEKKYIGTLTYQLDQEKIYLITNQYIGLEKTGEVVLAKKEGPYAVFLSPTRNDPDLAFKRRMLLADSPLSVQASILGQEGFGQAIDYRGKQIVGAWQFIPKLDWGMIVKIDHNEIAQSTKTLYNLFLLFLIIFIISLLACIYAYHSLIRQKLITINNTAPLKKIPSFLKNPLFIALLIFCGITIKTIIQYKKSKFSAVEKAKNKAKQDTAKNAEEIEGLLTKIAFVGQSIADDLRTDYLAKDDIATRIKRDLTEHTIITDITVLFAPYTYDKKTELHVKTTTNTVQAENIFKTNWYTQALEKKSVWIINPTKNSDNTEQTATYACTFFDKENKPNGVIAITFSLKKIIDIAESSGIGQTGYSIILTDNGSLIAHPIAVLVQTKTTLLQYAQSQGNEELATIAEKITTTNHPYIDSYSAESTHERFWISTHPISINNWTIGSIFSQEEIGLPPQTIRHYYFWILIWITITLLLLIALACNYGFFSFAYYAVIANAILILALIAAWYIIQTTNTINRESRTIITDQSNLNKFLNDLNDEAERKHEAKPINIPSGILLYSINMSAPDSITISGYLWNKYATPLGTTIVRSMDLPQATRMSYGNPLISQANNQETATWNIQGVLAQEQNYALYPFDQQQIQIILEHKDIEKNIMLTPDLIAYKKISPEATPGLDKDLSLPGFTIEQAFFEYRKNDPKTNFGFKEYGKVTDNYQLVYNAIMNRNLSNPFILFLLPLLVILFSLFTSLLITGKNTEPLSILGGYTGLFFALIVLQRSLREQHPTGTTLYMEYAFFYTYITIILLIIHTLLMYYSKNWIAYQNNSSYFVRILFWPFQFIAWFITTLIIFY